jgi:hypothetical protein
MSIHHTLQFIPTIIRGTAMKDAKDMLLDLLTPYMNYKTI